MNPEAAIPAWNNGGDTWYSVRRVVSHMAPSPDLRITYSAPSAGCSARRDGLQSPRTPSCGSVSVQSLLTELAKWGPRDPGL